MDLDDREMRVIEWIDSSFMGNWASVDVAVQHGLSTCVSIGFVIHEDDTRVVIAQSVEINHDGNVDAVLAIPKVAIRSWQTIPPAEGGQAGPAA